MCTQPRKWILFVPYSTFLHQIQGDGQTAFVLDVAVRDRSAVNFRFNQAHTCIMVLQFHQQMLPPTASSRRREALISLMTRFDQCEKERTTVGEIKPWQ